jgi:hypothetical protein
MFREYQKVRLRRAVFPLESGALGTVVMAYDFATPPGYEVEFMDAEGATLALLTLHDEDIEDAGNDTARKNSPQDSG